MVLQVNEVTKIRRRVLTETARLHWNGLLEKEVDALPEMLIQSQNQRYRCCEFKEKAIYAERIKLAMGLSLTKENAKKRLSTMAKRSLKLQKPPAIHQMEVIDIACDNCPIDKFFVTNACRNCLGHNCLQACRRNAIHIVGNQAYIDQASCAECGQCLRACKYGAIIEVHRPCEAACTLQAIKADQDRKARIDFDKCVDCGHCMNSCPFGAISDRSQLIQVINWLKGKEKAVALAAPALVGQMGQRDQLGPVIQALSQIGFADVMEVSLGADMVALAESEEFAQRVPKETGYLLSSCCPSFVKMVKEYAPMQAQNISSVVSPMIALAISVKKDNPEAKIVFIGPCISKKREAMESGVVDAVLTFEELAALFVAAEVNLATIEAQEDYKASGSKDGQNFAGAGGVNKAMVKGMARFPEVHFVGKNAQGIKECQDDLKALAQGQASFNFLEGMACSGGCLGGPGALVDERKTKRFMELRGESLSCQNLQENSLAQTRLAAIGKSIHTNKDK